MKRPDYKLKKEVVVSTGKFNNQDDPRFAAGTLVQPFWNETLLPPWRREELKIAKRMYSGPVVMCLIGTTWVPVEVKNIREEH